MTLPKVLGIVKSDELLGILPPKVPKRGLPFLDVQVQPMSQGETPVIPDLCPHAGMPLDLRMMRIARPGRVEDATVLLGDPFSVTRIIERNFFREQEPH